MSRHFSPKMLLKRCLSSSKPTRIFIQRILKTATAICRKEIFATSKTCQKKLGCKKGVSKPRLSFGVFCRRPASDLQGLDPNRPARNPSQNGRAARKRIQTKKANILHKSKANSPLEGFFIPIISRAQYTHKRSLVNKSKAWYAQKQSLVCTKAKLGIHKSKAWLRLEAV